MKSFHCLMSACPGISSRMRLACNYQLHGAPRIGEQANEPLRIVQQQIGTLIGGKATGKSCRKRVVLEPDCDVPMGSCPRRRSAGHNDHAPERASPYAPRYASATNRCCSAAECRPRSDDLLRQRSAPHAFVHSASDPAESQVGT